MTRDLLLDQLRLICATQRTIWPNPVAKGLQNASTLIVPLCVGISFEVVRPELFQLCLNYTEEEEEAIAAAAAGLFVRPS